MRKPRDESRYGRGYDDGLTPLDPLDPTSTDSVDALVRAWAAPLLAGAAWVRRPTSSKP